MRHLLTILALLAIAATAGAETGVHADEDWTDGAFDDSRWEWMISPSMGGFEATPHDGAPMAMVYKPSTSWAWGIAILELPADSIACEADEVLIQKGTLFSDCSSNSGQHHFLEIACLHKNEQVQFGHDHSIEHDTNFSYAGHKQSQLRPTVENSDWTTTTLQKAHVDGPMDGDALGQLYTNLVVFRPDGSGTNAEAFGTRAWDDMDISEQMYSYDQIQISMPRNYNGDERFAPGITASAAQKGFTSCHVGVTKVTDANLDYCTDARDFIIMTTNLGAGDAHMQLGDADNDGRVDGDDVDMWAARAGTDHAPGFAGSVSDLDFPLLDSGPDCALLYDFVTGEMSLDSAGQAVTSVLIEGPAATDALGGDFWSGYCRGAQQWADTSLAGVTGDEVLLGTYATGLATGDFGEILVGLASGGAVEVDEVTVVPEPASLSLLVLAGGATLLRRRR